MQKIIMGALFPSSILLESIYKTLSDNNSSNKSTLDELNLEAKKNSLRMDIKKAQAKVAQELAIAKRIETAKKVEIEEFYEFEGNGNVGLKSEKNSMNFGLTGQASRVSKRIYRFDGFADFLTYNDSESENDLDISDDS